MLTAMVHRRPGGQDVADVALHLPVATKLHDGVGKWILNQLAARHLPTRCSSAEIT